MKYNFKLVNPQIEIRLITKIQLWHLKKSAIKIVKSKKLLMIIRIIVRIKIILIKINIIAKILKSSLKNKGNRLVRKKKSRINLLLKINKNKLRVMMNHRNFS